MKNIQSILHWLMTPYYGSNRLSRYVRRHIEHRSIQELIGLPLAGLAFFGAIVMPKAQAGFDSTELYFDTQKTTVNAVGAESRFRWPLTTFGISQYFSYGHKGMDLTDPVGTPIHPVADGIVIYAGSSFFGYGKHVIVLHDNEIQSLYAHLSKIMVHTGDHVTKASELGEVGATGWATGNHLHLEIYLHGIQTNPQDILPEVTRKELR